jgi:hypothetical protein
MTLDPISRDYLALSFAIERHFPGFIDAYFGPPEIKAEAEAREAVPPAELAEHIAGLARRVAASDYPEPRTRFLAAQLRAMETIARRLGGEPMDYLDEVRALFDIEPEYTPESRFEEAIADLDDLLPGAGDVRERMIAWRARYVVSPEMARRLADVIVAEARRRTEAFVDLPANEGVEIAFVADKPWSGYNWYLGDAHSRIDINQDNPIHAHELAGLIAHETYPGHHAEHALKERVLYRERGYGEHAIQLINTPECVISEGIATLAESIIFPGDEGPRWQAENVLPVAGLEGEPEREAAIARALGAQRAVQANAAIMLHERDASEDQVVAYLSRYRLRTEAEARHSLAFIKDPLWRPYVFTYSVGRQLLSKHLAPLPLPERQAQFAKLLIEQITPSMFT